MDFSKKTAAFVFCVSFGIMFFIGSISGKIDQHFLLRAAALEHVSLQKRGNAVHLALNCKEKITHIYDVETDTLSPSPSELAASSVAPMVFLLRSHKDVIVAALGGGSGAITLATLSKTNKEGQAMKLIATVLGFASGYMLGYWMAASADLKCDSIHFKEFINKSDSWKHIKHNFLILYLSEIGVSDDVWRSDDRKGAVTLKNVNRNIKSSDTTPGAVGQRAGAELDIEPIKRCRPPITKRLSELVESLHHAGNPKKSDFELVLEYDAAVKALRSDEAYKSLKSCIRGLANKRYWRNHASSGEPYPGELFTTWSETSLVQDCRNAGITDSFFENASTALSGPTPPLFKIHNEDLFWFQSSTEFTSACARIFQKVLGSIP